MKDTVIRFPQARHTIECGVIGIAVVLFIFAFVLGGCAGGSRGTGGSTRIIGLVQRAQNGQPIPNVLVGLPADGVTTITGGDGRYEIEILNEGQELAFTLEASGFRTMVRVGSLADSVRVVSIDFTVDVDQNTATPVVTIEEDDSRDHGSPGQDSDNQNVNDNTSPNSGTGSNNDNDDDGLSGESNSNMNDNQDPDDSDSNDNGSSSGSGSSNSGSSDSGSSNSGSDGSDSSGSGSDNSGSMGSDNGSHGGDNGNDSGNNENGNDNSH